jgi:hypothetical protein
MTSIFISHSSKDKDESLRFQAWLGGKNHRGLFLDFDRKSGIKAGEHWERELYQKLDQCQVVLALVSKTWIESHWCFAEAVQARMSGKRLILARIDDVDTGSLFRDVQQLDFVADEAGAFERLESALTDVYDVAPDRPPYPGMRAYEKLDAGIFVGRDLEISELIAALRRMSRRSVGEPRMLLLLGASGSGKSSLVRAGVLPRLERQEPDLWHVLEPMRPRRDPIHELALLFAAELEQPSVDEVEKKLAVGDVDNPDPLGKLVESVLLKARRRNASALLVLDQLEDLLDPAAESSGRFLALLRKALDHDDGRLVVLGTLRSESLAAFQMLPFLTTPKPLRTREQTLNPMPLDRLETIIREPGRRSAASVTFADKLVERIKQDVGTSRDTLPLLAYTLNRLWDDAKAQAGGRFDVAAYDRVGGIQCSVRTVADATLDWDNRPDAERNAIRNAFVPGLVRVDSDGERRPRRASLTELQDVRRLLEPFVNQGLLVTYRDKDQSEVIEITHEALLRTWPRLDTWLQEDQDKLRLLDGLERAARDWQKTKPGRSPFLIVHRSGRLRDIQELLREPRFQHISELARDYLHHAELEQYHQGLATESTVRLETLTGDPLPALLRAYEADRWFPDAATKRALREAYKVAVLHYQNQRERRRFSGSGPGYLAGRWKQGEIYIQGSPDGKYRLLVTERGKDGANPPGDVYLIDNETLRVRKLEVPERLGGRVEDVAFDQKSQHVFVTRYFNLIVYRTDGRYIGNYEFSRHTKSPVHSVDGFLGDRYIIGAATRGGLWLVDLAQSDATLEVLFEFHGDAVLFCQISAKGRRAVLVFESGRGAILSIGEDGKPRLTDIASGEMRYAGFVGDQEDRVISSSQSGAVTTWDIDGDNIREASRLATLPCPIDSVGFDEDLKYVAAVGANQTIYVLDAVTGELLQPLNYADEIDWASVRAIPPSVRDVKPGVAVDLGPPESFPAERLHVAAVANIEGRTWLFTEDPEDNYSLRRASYVLESDVIRSFPCAAVGVEKHGDILWLPDRGPFGISPSGKAYWLNQGGYRPFPSADCQVNCVLEKDGVVWLGTSAGAFRHFHEVQSLVTPDTSSIEGIAEVGGRIWVWGSEAGTFVVDGDRLVRVTERFSKPRSIRHAAGAIWVLTGDEGIFGRSGPAYRVAGYLASETPRATARVSSVLEAGGFAWIAEQDRLHRVDEQGLCVAIGIPSYVDGMFQTGGTIWLTTHSGGSPGPIYRMNANTLVPEATGESGSLQIVAGRGWLKLDRSDGQSITAELKEDGFRELDTGGGIVQRIVEYNNEVWFLTSRGAYRHTPDGAELFDAPRASYHSLTGAADGLWLLGSESAVRIADGATKEFSTGSRMAAGVKRVCGETWILTGRNEFGGINDPGRAFMIRGDHAVEAGPTEGGVSDVVDIYGVPWLLTSKSGRPGPMIRGL